LLFLPLAFRPVGPGENSQAQRAWEWNSAHDFSALNGRARLSQAGNFARPFGPHSRFTQPDFALNLAGKAAYIALPDMTLKTNLTAA
jgi:hypothetical protein